MRWSKERIWEWYDSRPWMRGCNYMSADCANDCMTPKTEFWKPPYIGEQTYDWGYHGGKKHSQHGAHTEPAPHFYLDDEETREDYFRMVKEIVTKYKDDERICIWDVYNEPGNSRRGPVTLPNLKRMFETVREINPSQPVTAGLFCVKGVENRFHKVVP